MRWIARILATVAVLAGGIGSAQQAPAKLALVIGVSAYDRGAAAQRAGGFLVPPPLTNALRDSDIVASALESKGFSVTRVANPDKRVMLAAVNTFGRALVAAGPGAVGVFYFAGHGAQGRPALERDVDNYLIPLGADLLTETDLDSEALGLSRISEMLRPGERGAIILILDACRDFALPAASRSGMTTRGLAEARAAPGTIIAYATSPGGTALDGPPGQNGYYAKALAAQIRSAAGTRIEDVFIAVRNSVLADTHNTQLPWENGSLRRAVTLGVAAVLPPVGLASVAGTRQPPVSDRTRFVSQPGYVQSHDFNAAAYRKFLCIRPQGSVCDNVGIVTSINDSSVRWTVQKRFRSGTTTIISGYSKFDADGMACLEEGSFHVTVTNPSLTPAQIREGERVVLAEVSTEIGNCSGMRLRGGNYEEWTFGPDGRQRGNVVPVQIVEGQPTPQLH